MVVQKPSLCFSQNTQKTIFGMTEPDLHYSVAVFCAAVVDFCKQSEVGECGCRCQWSSVADAVDNDDFAAASPWSFPHWKSLPHWFLHSKQYRDLGKCIVALLCLHMSPIKHMPKFVPPRILNPLPGIYWLVKLIISKCVLNEHYSSVACLPNCIFYFLIKYKI